MNKAYLKHPELIFELAKLRPDCDFLSDYVYKLPGLITPEEQAILDQMGKISINLLDYLLDLSAAPFNLKNTEPSMMNPEFRELLNGDLPYLMKTTLVLEADKYLYEIGLSERGFDVLRDTHFFFGNGGMQPTHEEDRALYLERITEDLLMLENHVKIGRRLGLSDEVLELHDCLTEEISNKFDVRFVDCAIALDKAIYEKVGYDAERLLKDHVDLHPLFAEYTARYDVDVPDLEYSVDNYLTIVFGLECVDGEED